MAVTEVRQRASGRTTNPETLLTTELNALANNTASTAGPAISNAGTTELDMLVDLELVLSSYTPAASPYLEVWCIPSIDSTNYADTGVLVCVFIPTAGASAKREVIYDIPVPIKNHKWKIVNRSGALGATTNTLKGFYKSVGTGA